MGARQRMQRTRNIAGKLKEAVSTPLHISFVGYGSATGYTDWMFTLIDQRYCQSLGIGSAGEMRLPPIGVEALAVVLSPLRL